MAVVIDSNFPGGSVENVRYISDSEIVFEAPLDGSPRSLWFYFRIRGAAGKTITLRQDKLERVLGVLESRTYAMVRPVVREGIDGEWKRVSKDCIFFSHNPLDFRFTISPSGQETYVAFCYPYLISDLEDFIKTQNTSCIKKVLLGKSGEGRDFPALIIGNAEASSKKKLIVCEARQHAGEVSSSYLLEGFMDAYLSDTDFGRSIRDKAVLAVFPMVDIDGVQEGRYGKDRPPVDFNRDWSYEPKHPEVKLIQDAIGDMASRYELTLFIDLHSPQPGGNSYLIPARLSSVGRDKWYGLWKFAYEFEKNLKGICGFNVLDLDPEHLNWGGANYKFNAAQYVASKYGAPAVTLEASYHLDRDGRALGPKEWREMGGQLLNAASQYYVMEGGTDKVDYNMQIPSCEALWKHWELVGIPDRVNIFEDEECIDIESTCEGGEVWLAYRNLLPGGNKDRDLKKVVFDSIIKQKAQVEILLYYYKNGVAVKAARPSYIYLEHGRLEYEMDVQDQNDIQGFIPGIRIRNLSGRVSIRID